MRYILWALPQGKTDRRDEQPLTSIPLTRGQVEIVTKAAQADGWHGFRTTADTHDIPHFAPTLKL